MGLITGGGGGSFPTLAAGKVSLTSGNLTTTSATFVDATGLTVTLTTGARRCLVTLSCTVSNNGAGAVSGLDIAVDGTRQGGSLGLVDINASANFDQNGGIAFVTDVLSAASHTIKVQFKSNGTQTVTVFASATSPAVFAVVELPITS